MTITFESDNNVIAYGLEKIIAFARSKGYIFAAQCVWWLASIIELEQGLINHIDNLQSRRGSQLRRSSDIPQGNLEEPESEGIPSRVHPTHLHQVPVSRGVSAIPRDLSEDKQFDEILENTGQYIEQSIKARSSWQGNRVNPLPETKRHLKKARKVKRLQEARNTEEALRNQGLKEIRKQVIDSLS